MNRWQWICINLVAALLISRVVGVFEGAIAQLAALASLMPVVANMSGNIGNQTATLTIRALALDKINALNWREIMRGEFALSLIKTRQFTGLPWYISTLTPIIRNAKSPRPYIRYTTKPVKPPHTKPFIKLNANSPRIISRQFSAFILSNAKARIVSVAVWLPMLPLMFATTGIKDASAANCAIAPSKTPTTRDIKSAATRFMHIHCQRFIKRRGNGANKSSSSRIPALLSKPRSRLSCMCSTISSIVARPTTLPESSTTGALIKS